MRIVYEQTNALAFAYVPLTRYAVFRRKGDRDLESAVILRPASDSLSVAGATVRHVVLRSSLCSCICAVLPHRRNFSNRWNCKRARLATPAAYLTREDFPIYVRVPRRPSYRPACTAWQCKTFATICRPSINGEVQPPSRSRSRLVVG